MKHLVLLGDASFDNRSYTNGKPAVIDQINKLLPKDYKATLLAQDEGATTDIVRQLSSLPENSSFLIISVGGNDALSSSMEFLIKPVRNVGESLYLLAEMQANFQQSYLQMLKQVLDLQIPTAICTIYYPHFHDPLEQKASVTGLSLFNDVIIQAAFTHQLPLLDLRLICNEDSDYANPIEPSSHGGEKIATVIMKVLSEEETLPKKRFDLFY